jgi:hypothetical protein
MSEGDLFAILTLTVRARRLGMPELCDEWNRANQMDEVTAWYHVLSLELAFRDPRFMGGLRRGGTVPVPVAGQPRAGEHDEHAEQE